LRAICEQTLEPEYAKAAKELHKEGKVFLAKVRNVPFTVLQTIETKLLTPDEIWFFPVILRINYSWVVA
jgi:hypothetical protein